MSLTAGTRLGPYEIVAPLGAGGMGEVYRAKDTRLDRHVAVKILPAQLAADPQFRERFDREARAISQLTHPHICRLYDLGEQDGVSFLVMELLEGETIEARLAKGPIPLAQALSIAIDVAGALATAHRAGIVHRDLKPGNIFLARGATASAPPVAKLLDFGLAKTAAPVISTSGLSMAPTTPPSMTAAGTILGTFQYMAPEQIEGVEADGRSDIFAFGAVLYEMIAGKKAFEGKTRAALLGAILKDDPAPLTPPAVDRVVRTCLAKEPDDRWQTARDLQRELQWIASGAASSAIAPSAAAPPPSSGALRTAAVAIVSAAIVGVAVWILTRPAAPPAKPLVHLQVLPAATGPVFVDPVASDVAFSPDGTHVAYAGGTAQSPLLYVRDLAQAEPLALAGTENSRGPFFSPDGQWIAYFQLSAIKKVSIHGGPSLTVCGECAPGNRGGAWGRDDAIVFSPRGGSQGLQSIPSAGGDPKSITTVDGQKGETGHVWPELLPSGDTVLFAINSAGAGPDGAVIAARNLKTGVQKVLVRGGTQPRYASSGYLIYVAAGTVRAVNLDAATLEASGNPVPVLDRVAVKNLGSADFAVSRNGSLAYVSGTTSLAGGQQIAWVDRQGHEEMLPLQVRPYVYLRIAPDGNRLVLDIRDQQNDIWIWDFRQQQLRRLTTDPSIDQYPIWTPDGERIVYTSSRGGAANLYWQRADGSGTAERLTTDPLLQYALSFTGDGKTLVLRITDPKWGPDLATMSMAGDRTVKPLFQSAASTTRTNAEISPDGRWLAYQSSESGREEIYVRPFPAVGEGVWQVSTDGGTRPAWSRNGLELFYTVSSVATGSVHTIIMAAPVHAGAAFAAGKPGIAAETTANSLTGTGRFYDVSPDGKRFLIIRNAPSTSAEPAKPAELHVVLNWDQELKRLLPAK